MTVDPCSTHGQRSVEPGLYPCSTHGQRSVEPGLSTPAPHTDRGLWSQAYSPGARNANLVRVCSHYVWLKCALIFMWMRFDHVAENFASTRKYASARFRFLVWAALPPGKITISYFWISGVFQRALILYWTVNVDDLIMEKASNQLLFLFLQRKEHISQLAFSCDYVRVNLFPVEDPIFTWVRLGSRLHKSETPSSKTQICLAMVMKTQRFALNASRRDLWSQAYCFT